MIVEMLALYEAIVEFGVVAGILFLLYSGNFVVIHRRFLGIIALGSGLTGVSQILFLIYWPVGIQLAHLIFILFLTRGLYSLITGYPTEKEGWFKAVFSE